MSKEFILITLFIVVVSVLSIARRRNLMNHLAVAVFFGCGWMVISHTEYSYNSAVTTVLGINLFSLFGWIMGLFASYLLYSWVRKTLIVNKWWKQFLVFSIIYIPMLLVVETIGYHMFGIVNLATATYPGLAICNCLHAPAWMVASYISMGPLYFIACLLLGLESDTKPSRIYSGYSSVRNRIAAFISRA